MLGHIDHHIQKRNFQDLKDKDNKNTGAKIGCFYII
jgi:hypothetical protein